MTQETKQPYRVYRTYGYTEPMNSVASVYGVRIPTDVPCTGVINGNGPSLSSFDPFEEEHIDTEYEEWASELIPCPYCEEGEYEGKPCDTCEGKAEIPRSESHDEEYHSETSYLLLGSWRKDVDGKYEPDPEGEYSAIWSNANGSIIQVVLSRYIMRVRSYCSPCFPGQADLDSGETELGYDGIMAYCLPPGAYSNPGKYEDGNYLCSDPEWKAPRIYAPCGDASWGDYHDLAEVLAPFEEWNEELNIFRFYFSDCFQPPIYMVGAEADHWDTAMDLFVESMHDLGKEKDYIREDLKTLMIDHYGGEEDPDYKAAAAEMEGGGNTPDYFHCTGQGIWYYSENLAGSDLGPASSYFVEIHKRAEARRLAIA